MAVKLDNMDSVLKGLAKLDKSVGSETIRDARKRMKSTVKKYIPLFRKLTKEKTIKRTGDLVKSIKVRSRSRRGATTIKLIFSVPYAGFVNFTQDTATSNYASEEYENQKKILERQGREDIKEAFKATFKKYGIKFK